jgi:hypothetical protein|tara:strand:- start:5012 stop:5458 length:447 start_codon:yes stop_codon:yes gene_type:complete
MAHFAEIKSEDNKVVRVIVVNDDDVANNGGEYTSESETWVANNHDECPFVKEQHGGTYPSTYWKQTSYNNNARQIFAGIGFTYDLENDIFMPPKPFPSWTWDASNLKWDPPSICSDTTEGAVYWDEENQRWKNAEGTKYWDGSAWQNV